VRGGELNLYRAEAGGKLAWQITLNKLAECHQQPIRCNVYSYCDNLALVQVSQWKNKLDDISDMLKPEFDLLVAIHRTNEELRTRATKLQQPKHVKGHQETRTPVHLLSLEAQLNMEADALATEALTGVLVNDRVMLPIDNPHC
jgi:hypothetical protein